MQLSGGSLDIRERIARHLDMALFDSVIAAEVRTLATCGSFDRLFDGLSQFLSQVMSYRWMAVLTTEPDQFASSQRWSRRSTRVRGDQKGPWSEAARPGADGCRRDEAGPASIIATPPSNSSTRA
jgi:hypothetical protein